MLIIQKTQRHVKQNSRKPPTQQNYCGNDVPLWGRQTRLQAERPYGINISKKILRRQLDHMWKHMSLCRSKPLCFQLLHVGPSSQEAIASDGRKIVSCTAGRWITSSTEMSCTFSRSAVHIQLLGIQPPSPKVIVYCRERSRLFHLLFHPHI